MNIKINEKINLLNIFYKFISVFTRIKFKINNLFLIFVITIFGIIIMCKLSNKVSINEMPSTIVKCKVLHSNIVEIKDLGYKFKLILSDPKNRYFSLYVNESTYYKSLDTNYLYFRLNENQIDSTVINPQDKYIRYMIYVFIIYVIIVMLLILTQNEKTN